MRAGLRRIIGSLTALLFVAAADPAFACPVCFGATDSPAVQGMQKAIVALLIVTGGVLAAFGTFFIYLMRKARASSQTMAVPASAHGGS